MACIVFAGVDVLSNNAGSQPNQNPPPLRMRDDFPRRKIPKRCHGEREASASNQCEFLHFPLLLLIARASSAREFCDVRCFPCYGNPRNEQGDQREDPN
jgi:hypothetical protein